MNICYLGPEGTYTHEAAQAFVKRLSLSDSSLIPFSSIEEVVKCLVEKKTLYAVLPLHNTIAGDYKETHKGIDEYSLQIADTLNLPIHISLGVHSQSSRDDIREIRSKDTALKECSNYLSKHFPTVSQVEVASTALTMQQISSENLHHVGALGSNYGMQLYGLNIIANEIENTTNNTTRFIFLEHKL